MFHNSWLLVQRLFIERMGRVKIQMMDFFFLELFFFFFFWMNVALVHLTLGIPNYMYWDNKPNTSFLVLYALTFFFSNVETQPLL